MMKNIFYIILLALLALFVGVSCEQKELLQRSEVESEVEVKFDWTNAPGAAPKKMVLCLFPEGGGNMLRYEFDNANGGRIFVPIGTYDALCMNGDTQGVLYRNTDRFNTYEAYTDNVKIIGGLNVDSSVVPRAEGTERERMVAQADKLWRGTASDKLVIKPRSTAATLLTMSMTPNYEAYNIIIRNVNNLDGANAKFGASISTLAGSALIADGSLGSESVTIPTILTVDEANRTMTGRVVAFGNCVNSSQQHFMMVYAILSDGQKYGFKFDVSSQIHNAADKQNVQIVIDGFDLPKPIGKDSGLKPEVHDWKVIDVKIDIK